MWRRLWRGEEKLKHTDSRSQFRLCRSDTAVSAIVTNGVVIGAVSEWNTEGIRLAGLNQIRSDCTRTFGLDKLGTLRPHICKAHREDHHQENRKPNASGLIIGLTIVPPTGGIGQHGRTFLFTVYESRAEAAPALTVRFPVSPESRISYDTALARAQQLLGNELIPSLAVRRWPKRHSPVVGPSGGAAFFCAVISLMTNFLCCSDTAVSAVVTNGVALEPLAV
ncbi:hypothetical protein niasHS_000842 [Heterodera schachtii]|uniref:Uncharacterized protein n=1 Tax=Heterodera schachtii TaxID=97005 RepID=A0ABD2KLU5_HETSC